MVNGIGLLLAILDRAYQTAPLYTDLTPASSLALPAEVHRRPGFGKSAHGNYDAQRALWTPTLSDRQHLFC